MSRLEASIRNGEAGAARETRGSAWRSCDKAHEGKEDKAGEGARGRYFDWIRSEVNGALDEFAVQEKSVKWCKAKVVQGFVSGYVRERDEISGFSRPIRLA